VVTKRSSASTRTSHFSTNGQRKHKREASDQEDNASDDEEESDKEEPPPKSKRRSAAKDQDKAVHYTMDRRHRQDHHRGCHLLSFNTAPHLLNGL